ncbi:LysR family transcriptional regulator [Ramlibacter tataouinensis]|uniref:LysR family transcriptional regulator n=1 Tax=Ramlibacter tataouinensis TaxID=94132 RepID=UPI0022F3AB69|nr:LysR family transcriptional regulator [Ramlibacter tataouinensis]WBY01425.1 LysR family transcriptional regulator [Ramlibacter tataouinensis]
MLTFKQIEALHWVARSGSFAAAADRLHTTQSAISKRIAELEDILGVALFDRTRRTARLTEKAREIVALGEELLNARERLLAAAGREAVTIRQFRIGVTELIALTWLPRLVKLLRAQYPHVEVQPEIDLSANLYEKLGRGALDLVVVPSVFNESSMLSTPLRNLRLSWMCSPSLYDGPPRLALAEIARYPILMQIERSGVDMGLERWFRERDLTLRRLYAGNSLVALSALTIGGFGISFLPSEFFMEHVEAGRLRVIESDENLPEIPYCALYLRDGPVSFSTRVAAMAQSICSFAKPQWDTPGRRPRNTTSR